MRERAPLGLRSEASNGRLIPGAGEDGVGSKRAQLKVAVCLKENRPS